EAGHAAPCRPKVSALPEAVAAAGSKEQDVVRVGVNHQALAHRSAWRVPAELEGKIRALEGIPLVAGAKNSAIRSRERIRVSAGRDIQPIGVGRVRRDAFDPESIPVGEADEVHEGYPFSGRRVPSVRSPDVGSGIDEVTL